MIDFAHGKGIAVVNAAPFAGGVLAAGSASNARYVYQETNDAMLAPVRAVEAVCERYGIPLGAAALQSSMRDPRITSTICGVSSPKEIDEIIAWANTPIPDAAWDEFGALPVSHEDPEATRNYVAPS
jgi:D-threo-aldose 1-dehydrogenase